MSLNTFSNLSDMYHAKILAQAPLEKYWCMYCTLYIVQERWCTDGCRKLYFCCLHISLSENPEEGRVPCVILYSTNLNVNLPLGAKNKRRKQIVK